METHDETDSSKSLKLIGEVDIVFEVSVNDVMKLECSRRYVIQAEMKRRRLGK